MNMKDSRIKLVNEVLNGMKVIKLYAWEIPFGKLIMDIRNAELNILRKYAFLGASFSFTMTCAPFVVRQCCVFIDLTLVTFLLISLFVFDLSDLFYLYR